jgi:hypothetical protein
MLPATPPADADAKLDTGADISVIPSTIRLALGLHAAGYVTTRGALGEAWKSIPIYLVRFRVAGGPPLTLRVVESPKSYVLLGRDVLNRYILTANGPAGHFDLDLPTP